MDQTNLLLKSDVYIIDTPKWNLTVKRVGEDEFEISGNTEAFKGETKMEIKVGEQISIPLKGQKMIREPAIKLRHNMCWLTTVDTEHMTENEFVDRAIKIREGDWWV
jgi:hypothetical protein